MVREITIEQARRRKRLVGVIDEWGYKTYYAVSSLDEWRTFVKRRLGYY